jgi:gluconolactonase
MGHNFSSVNDVKQHYHTGDVWFTDAQYGFLQYFRPNPNISPQAYRFEPKTGVIQALTDHYVQPNGIEFSPDFKTVYITDTGARLFESNYTRPATIYAYDVLDEKYLRNRRLFAYVDSGIPDGIHTDTQGNVWSGVGDGVSVWNSDGVLLGKIRIENGVANFGFIPGGMLIFNEYRLFHVRLAAVGREIMRDFGPNAKPI